MDIIKSKHPEIGEIPRPDKAYVYLISNSDLKELNIKRGQETQNLDKIHQFTRYKYYLELKKTEKIENDGNFQIRKGDMVYIQPLLNSGNRGKYIYLDSELVEIESQVPEIIQVILDVPIRYYEGRIDTTLVPFNFRKNIGNIDRNNILTQGRFPYFKFQRNGETYIIAADYESKNRSISNDEFLEELKKAEYFSFIPLKDKEDYLKLGDWRNIMYLSLKITY
jgi:hypothetical protein